MIIIFFGKDKILRVQKTNEEDFIENCFCFYEQENDGRVLFSKITLNEAILIEAEQDKQEMLDNLIALGKQLSLQDTVYRCDYIQACYQSEEISELEACVAFLKQKYKTFFLIDEKELPNIIKTGNHPIFSHPRAVEIIQALKEENFKNERNLV